MRVETWDRVRELFERAAGRSPEERARLVASVDDPEARGVLERLLADEEAAAGFLEPTPSEIGGLLREAVAPVEPGTRIGRFEVLRVLAVGGMGTVYEAVQDEPRRPVALKTLRFGPTTPESVHRFRYEAEVLGRLRHPNVAQVHEAGTHERAGASIPYLAMELVEGARDVVTHAEARRLPTRERIALFLFVADAVAHAHAKGVIHRDLKPANVLVDGSGRVKVIDFGVARAAEIEPEATRALTRQGQLVGTLGSMSPEQLEGDPDAVDARSDVYALGVLLYELLSRRPPYELAGTTLGEALRRKREPPPRLSSADPKLAGELEWVTARAMEAEPERRYASVSELAADLRRHLAGEPVLASPPSATYRLGKLLRRHRALFLSAAAVVLALAAGLVRAELARRDAERARAAELAQRDEAERARDHALTQASTAHEVTTFLAEILASAAPRRLGRDARLVEVLEVVAEKLERSELRPEVRAYLLMIVGNTYHGLGENEEAARHLDAAWELVGDDPPDERAELAAQVASQRATLLADLGRFAESEALLRRAVELAAGGTDRARRIGLFARATLAHVLRKQGELDAALATARDAVAAVEAELGPDDPATLVPRRILATALTDAGEVDEALALLRDTLERHEGRLEPDDQELVETRAILAKALLAQLRAAEAEDILEDVLAWRRENEGEAHPATLETMQNLASARIFLGRDAEAEALLARAVEGMRETLGDRHPMLVGTLNNLAALQLRRGDAAASASTAREGLELCGEVLGEDHPYACYLESQLVEALLGQGKVEEGSRRLAIAIERDRRVLGPDHPRTVRDLELAAEALARLERWDELEARLEELLDALPADDPRRAELEARLGEARAELAAGD